jgi:opacity protein-like surface antigen
MMTNVLKYACAVVALMLVTGVAMPRSAAAQSGAVDFAAGYSFVHDTDVDNFAKGWFASVAGGVNSWLAIVGEAAGNYKTVHDLEGQGVDLSIHFFGAGPRFVSHSGRAHPFGQVLFGAGRGRVSFGGESASQTDFAWQPGAGVDWDLNRNVGLRLGANGRFIHGDDATAKEFQVVVGLVFGRGR